MLSQKEMYQLVPEKLKEIENKYSVKVLYAAESGSRAWGFASPDSDFDVRFIYKRTQESYLHLNQPRDVIELPIDDTWDVSGWDLDKTLKLLYKSNPTLYEWLGSPVRYWESGFEKRIFPIAEEYFSVEKMLYHYLNTARNNISDYLSRDEVQPKKYFYALRPILACEWTRKKHSVPPVLFDNLVNAVLPDLIRDDVSKLLELKINGPEKMTIPHVKRLDEYLSECINDTKAYLDQLPKEKPKSWSKLNEFFLTEISL